MSQDIDQILSKYRGKGIIIDTNLLLLFIVGTHDPDRITTFKRTKKFGKDDYVLVKRFIDCFKTVRTTPSILTEVSNHLNQLPEELHAEFYTALSDCINKLFEVYETSATLSKNDCFTKYGLTDTSIIADAKNNYVVLTDDFPLSGYLNASGVDAINFNHLRTVNWYS
jgi:rRNA-processing protein FCF1